MSEQDEILDKLYKLEREIEKIADDLEEIQFKCFDLIDEVVEIANEFEVL